MAPQGGAGARIQERDYRPEFPIVLDLFFRESQLNVYAGNRVVRPPYAPTIGPDCQRRMIGNPWRVGKPLATRTLATYRRLSVRINLTAGRGRRVRLQPW
jgi:hypothetical protein